MHDFNSDENESFCTDSSGGLSFEVKEEDQLNLKPVASDLSFRFLKNQKENKYNSHVTNVKALDAPEDVSTAKKKSKIFNFENNYKFTLDKKKPEYSQISM